MEAVFSFKNVSMNFQDLYVGGINSAGGTSTSVFTLDRQVMQQQNANMALFAKRQNDYLNM